MVEPTSLSKSLEIFKSLPLWLLVSVSTALAVLLWYPGLINFLSTEQQSWTVILFVLFLCMTVCLAWSKAIQWYGSYQKACADKRTFHLTPVELQSYWHPAKQPDGSMMTQMHVTVTCKNLTTDRNVHLVGARLISPKIKGEVTHNMVTLRAPNSNMHGTAHVSGHHLPPASVLPGTIDLMVRGIPRRNPETLTAVLVIQDAEGNETRIKVRLRKA